MHDTLTEALRAHARPDDERRRADHLADDPPAAAAAAPDPISSLLDVIRRATTPSPQDGDGKKPAPPMHPGLQKYLENFSKEKRTVRVPPEAVLGSEAHERLRARYARRYEAEEGVQEGGNGGGKGGKEGERGPARDEL